MMSVNRKRSEPCCIRCEKRPQVFGLLCETCFTELEAACGRPRARLAPLPRLKEKRTPAKQQQTPARTA